MDSDTIYVDAEIVAKGGRAILCNVEGEEFWIPHSEITNDSELDGKSDKGDEGTLAIKRWLAEERGIE